MRNFANNSGGAFYWNDIEPYYTSISEEFYF